MNLPPLVLEINTIPFRLCSMMPAECSAAMIPACCSAVHMHCAFRFTCYPGFQVPGLFGPPPTMKNHRVFEVFHKIHLKSHFLTCNFLMCLLHFGLVMSDFLMGLLHFCFSFFLGCPDGFQERFSVILVALWEPLGPSWGLLGVP